MTTLHEDTNVEEAEADDFVVEAAEEAKELMEASSKPPDNKCHQPQQQHKGHQIIKASEQQQQLPASAELEVVSIQSPYIFIIHLV